MPLQPVEDVQQLCVDRRKLLREGAEVRYYLVTYYVLVVTELSTRRVEIARITLHPTTAFMQQCARQLTDHFDGFLLSAI